MIYFVILEKIVINHLNYFYSNGMYTYKADIHIHHNIHDPNQIKISYHYANFTNKSNFLITLIYQKKLTRHVVWYSYRFALQRKQNFLYQYFREANQTHILPG